MNHTIIVTPEVEAQRLENIRNECKRHCRIGKVRHRLPKGWTPDPAPVFRPFAPLPVVDHDFNRQFFGAGMKCSCKPGTPCNNVACPHLPRVTCSTVN